MSTGLKFTGERYVPGTHGSIELEHLHRYFIAREFSRDKFVLDIASGEGYGSAILADVAATVVGVDISLEAVMHSREVYKKENLRFLEGSCSKIPLPDASVDVVVSFETIEHHDEHQKMMLEIKRVLRADGILIISSPDKQNYSIEPNLSNPHHVKELYCQEFKSLLSQFFKNNNFFGQKVVYGSAIFAEAGTRVFSFTADHASGVVQGMRKPQYWIAVSSDMDLPEFITGILEDSLQNSEGYKAMGEAIDALNSAITLRDSQVVELNQALTSATNELHALRMLADQRGELIESIHSSLPWRLLSPVRRCSNFFISFFNIKK